jgi:hypothetical protein
VMIGVMLDVARTTTTARPQPQGAISTTTTQRGQMVHFSQPTERSTSSLVVAK